MKRSLPLCTLLFVLLFSAFSLQTVYSQPLLVENFDYPDGTELSTVGWTIHSGTDNPIDVTVPGLTFTGYPLSDIGGAARLDAKYIDVNKTFSEQTEGPVYVAFMVKVLGGADGYFIHLGKNPFNTNNLFGRVWLKASGTDWVFGVSKTSNTPAVATEPIVLNSTYLLVLKYEIIADAANDLVSLYVISGEVPSSEPGTATLVASDPTNPDNNPGAIALRQYDADQNILVDGIRIGKTWAEAVTDIPSADVTAPVFTEGYPKMNNIDATQADIEVNMDEAGTAYYVVVPDGATAPTVAEVVAGSDYGTVTLTAHGTIDVAAGGASYSATLTGLTDKTNYDIYVIAEDDESTPNRQAEVVMVNLYTIRPPDVIMNVDFASSLAPFTQVSITGDQVWTQTSGYAKISGNVSSTYNENLDYLISPVINLSASETNMLSFRTMMYYAGPALKVMISTDFSGTYDATNVNAATWTDITSNFSFSTGSWASVNSGEFDLAAYSSNVYIAFVYESTTAEASTWEVDDIQITGYLLPGSDASLSDLKVDDVTIAGFDAAVLSYNYVLEADWSTTPVVTFTTTDDNATADVTGPADLNGDAAARTASVTVIATDGITTQTYTIQFDPIIAIADMAALRAVASADYDRIYQVTGEVIVTGLNDANRHQKYVQDATAGVTIDDPDGKITTVFSVGDGIKNLTGTLTKYMNLLELVPYRDPGAAFSTGNTVTPQEVTIADFKTNQESYESELVKIIGVSFSDANGTAAFAEKKNYTISAGTDATILRTIFLGTDLKDKVIPYMADVTGIAAVYSSDAQVAPRNYADLVIYSSDGSLSDLRVNGTTVTGFAAGTLTYNVSLAAGTTIVPTVTATPGEANATVIITPASSLTGDATARTAIIEVTSHDKSVYTTYTIVFSVATGIEDNLSGRFRIYPVPATISITASGIDDVKFIEIYDVTGNKLITEICEGEHEKKIPLSQLARGVYFIRFITPQETVMKRFVKE